MEFKGNKYRRSRDWNLLELALKLGVNQMKDKIFEAELQYKKGFSHVDDQGSYFKLEDPRLPDMRAHNIVILKSGTPLEESKKIIADNLNWRKSEGCDFLTVISFDRLTAEDLNFTDIQPKIDLSDYMSIETASTASLKFIENAEVMLADNEKDLKAGKMIDIEANEGTMGETFVVKRINRKIEVYKDETVPLDFYVIYYKGEPAGNCELFLGNEIAQIEDFDILPKFQRMGLGTHFVKVLLNIAGSKGYKNAFVITDHFDSAKEMYKKCGFSYEGTVTELLYNL